MKRPHVLISETTCAEYVQKIKRLGWGRMFCQRTINPFDDERWGFDNGAFLDWSAGMPFNEDRFLRRLDKAREAGCPYMAVAPDIVAGEQEKPKPGRGDGEL